MKDEMKKINSDMELLIMKYRSEVEEIYISKEFKEDLIQNIVRSQLEKDFEENKISATEYITALEILKKHKIN